MAYLIIAASFYLIFGLSRMGKKSKRRGGGKLKETRGTDDSRSNFDACLGRFQQIAAACNPSEKVFQKHKVLVTKRLEVATGVGALDEYRFAFDRLFLRVAAAAEGIDALPDHVSSIDDDVLGVLKEASHDFINTPIADKIRKHSHFSTLSTWCKIVIITCHFDSPHLASSEALIPLFDTDAADLLRQVSSNDNEPMTLRTMAMVARATIMFRNCNELNEVSYRRRANSYFAQIVDSEYPLVSGAEGVMSDLLSAAMGIATPDYLYFFSSAVTGIIRMSNDRLTALEGPPRLPKQLVGNADAGNKSAEQIEYVAKYAFSVGGAFCDHCRKSRQDALVVNLFKCDDCRLAHYCSKNCQKEAWDAGHNQYCRKVGCFNVGDLVLFEGGEKGRRHATVVEKCEDSNLLKCKIIKTEETEVVDKKELRHIRPLH